MSKEIIDILLSSKFNFKSAQTIGTSYHEAEGVVYDLFWKEIESQGGKGTQKIYWKNYIIEYSIHQDPKGIFFGFKAMKSDRQAVGNNSLELNIIKNVLKEIKSEFKNSINWLGWIHPSTIRKFYSADIELIYNLNNTVFRKEFVSKLIDEGQSYFLAFAKKVEELN